MKIVHINTIDCRGGAARAAYRLHEGLRRQGHDSCMFVADRTSSDPSVDLFAHPTTWMSRVLRRLRRYRITRSISRYESTPSDIAAFFSDDRTMYGSEPLSQIPTADILHLHWIAWFIDYQAFFSRVSPRTSLVWTLHDMVAFTGGCHYDRDCGKFVKECGACPQFGSNDPRDVTNQVWRRKRKAFGNLRPEQLHVVAPSRWLAAEARRSSLLSSFPTSVIPYGLDINVFAPRHRETARAVFGIPQNAKVVLFVADYIHTGRKGFGFLSSALAGLADVPRLFLVSLGEGIPPKIGEIPHLYLGHMGKDGLLSLAYSAADIFIITSLQDNFPNTVMESLACGTPVVGFAVGGIVDMVESGVHGLLVPREDLGALRGAIRRLLENDAERAGMSVNCRDAAVKKYALEVQARQYAQLYADILRTNGHEKL